MARLLSIENTGEMISMGFGTKGRPCVAVIIAKHLRDDSTCLSVAARLPLVSESVSKGENDGLPRSSLRRDPCPLEIIEGLSSTDLHGRGKPRAFSR